MPGVTYKCPSCGAYLSFDPETQHWKCDFCDSTFEQNQLDEVDQASAQPQAGDPNQVVYHCPSCGSEIITDETTVATRCYYCHSPVVLQGKLTPDMTPDEVLPFTIDKDEAVQSFMRWVKGKKYVPKAFFSQSQVEMMSGVYYPHFVTDCELDGRVEGEGRNTRVMDTSRYIVTNTDHYQVLREARITLRNIMRPALAKANRKLSDGIHPFPLEKAKPFDGSYLSGFVAERRDIEQNVIQSDVGEEVKKYVEPLLTDTIHYNSYSVTPTSKMQKMRSRYVLLPTWVLTYPNPKDANDPYYYAMNGCTGEVCGKLPVDKKKLRTTGIIVFAAVLAAALLISYFFV